MIKLILIVLLLSGCATIEFPEYECGIIQDLFYEDNHPFQRAYRVYCKPCGSKGE